MTAQRTALVLSGGGAGGAFHIGVLESLWPKEKANISAIYGTSVGALNGCALRWVDFEALYQIWLGIKSSDDVLKTNWLAYLGFATGKYSTKPLKGLIDFVTAKDPVNPDVDVWVTAVNLESSILYYFKHDFAKFKDMVLASASVPFHMEPVNGYVDGGVRDHTPLRKAIKAGFERIIVITSKPLSALETDQNWKMKWPYLLEVGLRCTDILQAEVYANDIESIIDEQKALGEGLGAQIEVYAPDVRIIDTFEYDPVKIRMAIDQGRRAYQSGRFYAQK